MTSYTLPEMVTRVRDLLVTGRTQTALSPLSDDRIVNNLLSAYNTMSLYAVRNGGRPELLSFKNADPLEGTTDGSTNFRRNEFTPDIIAVTLRSGLDEEPRYDEFVMILKSWSNDSLGRRKTGVNFDFRSDGILRTVGYTQGAKCRVWMSRRPPLHSGTLAAGTVNSITFPATPTLGKLGFGKENVIGSLVLITTGSASGQYARISDYNPVTRVATMQNADSPTGDAFTTAPGEAGYSMMSWFSGKFDDLLCMNAALMQREEPLSDEMMLLKNDLQQEWVQHISMFDQGSTFHTSISGEDVDINNATGYSRYGGFL